MRKEVFVCDNCGTRKRLDSSQRHWCDECTSPKPFELRSVRDRKPPELASYGYTAATTEPAQTFRR